MLGPMAAGVTRPTTALLSELIARHGYEDTPTVYTDPRLLVRELFWRRLEALLALSRSRGGRALDFGGGNGVLLPTLARRFDEVTCVDVHAGVARALLERQPLANVAVREGRIESLALPENGFDAIVAADVLEHMEDLAPVARELARVLRPGGELLVSLPSENPFYELGRALFRYRKPEDHYHAGASVVEELGRHLRLRTLRWFPLNVAPLGVFLLARLTKPEIGEAPAGAADA
jgi:SAM-dependent methyltransferase